MRLPLFYSRRANRLNASQGLDGLHVFFAPPHQGSGQQSPAEPAAGDSAAQPFLLPTNAGSTSSSSAPATSSGTPSPSASPAQSLSPSPSLSHSETAASTSGPTTSSLQSPSLIPTPPFSAPSSSATLSAATIPSSASTSPFPSHSSPLSSTSSPSASESESAPASPAGTTLTSSVALANPTAAIAASSPPPHVPTFYIALAFAIVAAVALALALFAWWYRIRTRSRRRPWEINSRVSSRVNNWWEPSRDRDAGEPRRSTSSDMGVVREKQTSFELVLPPAPPPARQGFLASLRPSQAAFPPFGGAKARGARIHAEQLPAEDIGTPREPQNAIVPRYLGLGGDGLDVPWATEPRPGATHAQRNESTPPPRPDTATAPVSESRWHSRLANRPLPVPPSQQGESWTDSLCRRANLRQGFNFFSGGARAPVNSTDFAAVQEGNIGKDLKSGLGIYVPQGLPADMTNSKAMYARHVVQSPSQDLSRPAFALPVPPLLPQHQGVLRNPYSIDDIELCLPSKRKGLSLVARASDSGSLSRSSSVAISRASSAVLSRGPTMIKLKLHEHDEAAWMASKGHSDRSRKLA